MYSRQCLIDAETVDARRAAASADADVVKAAGVDAAALLLSAAESVFLALRRIEPDAVDGVDGRGNDTSL